MNPILLTFLVVSFALNFYLLFERTRKKPKDLAPDARQLLHDLTRGGGLVRVLPLDPEGLMYFSPRHKP